MMNLKPHIQLKAKYILFTLLFLICLGLIEFNSNLRCKTCDKRWQSMQRQYFKSSDTNSTITWSQSTNVSCLLMTSPGHQILALHVTATWITDCSNVITLTSQKDSKLKNVFLSRFDSYDLLWGKVLEGFKEVDPISSSWFLKVDDDTVVIMDNLKQLLSKLDPNEPLLIGLQLFYPNKGQTSSEHSISYVAGGTGYILSSEAVRRLQITVNPLCFYPGVTQYEDVNMGACLNALGVQQIDTRDALGRPRFIPYPPQIMINPASETNPKYFWLKEKSKYPVHFGAEHLTDLPISFHEIRNEDDIYLLHYFSKYFRKEMYIN